MNRDAVTKAIVALFDSERFYAELVLQMNRIISTKVPTAGVCIKDSGIELHINPEFFTSLTQLEQVALLKHECQHIINNHISRFKELAPDIYSEGKKDIADRIVNNMKHQTLNVAADCAINEGIPNLPEGGCYPKNFDLPAGQTMEYYAEALKKNEKFKVKFEDGEGEDMDDHSLWGESDGDKDELKEKIRKVLNKAAENTRAAGKLTSDQELMIERLNHKPRDWKADLKRFAARSMEVKIETSRKKRNRRYGIMHPGIIKEETLHIGVAIDTSGSISDEALEQFMTEIGNMAKYATVTVVEADTRVQNSYVFDPKKKYKVKGRGGTAYQPALDYFNTEVEEPIDGLIYLGDMDNYDNEQLTKPKYPVLWAIIGNQKPPASWGFTTKIEIKRK